LFHSRHNRKKPGIIFHPALFFDSARYLSCPDNLSVLPLGCIHVIKGVFHFDTVDNSVLTVLKFDMQVVGENF